MLLPRDVAAQASRWWTDLEGETGGSVPHVRRGEWISFLRASATCDEQAAGGRNRKCHHDGDDVERRVTRAERLVELGEMSSARQALEGAAVAPGDQEERRRPQQPREPLSPDMMTFQPEIEKQLDEMFRKNL